MLMEPRSGALNSALNFPDLLNVRDLGGYPTTDGAYTRSRSLLRADDLVQLRAAGLRALADYGVRTVLDLRWPQDCETAWTKRRTRE